MVAIKISYVHREQGEISEAGFLLESIAINYDRVRFPDASSADATGSITLCYIMHAVTDMKLQIKYDKQQNEMYQRLYI